MESIYNLATVEQDEIQKEEPIYKSKYKQASKDFYDTKKSPFPRTMGFSQTPLRNPQDYLKKHSGEKRLEEGTKSVSCLCREPSRIRVSRKAISDDETPTLMKRSKRNFIAENSSLAQRRPATAPERRIVDDKKGHSIGLENSGLVPKYISKEDYGQIPKYIQDTENSLEESRARFRDFLVAEKMRTMPMKMSYETKEKIFEGIVRNWKELLRRFLIMHNVESLPQRKRKMELERRIDSLEKDIEMLIRHRDIFINRRDVSLLPYN